MTGIDQEEEQVPQSVFDTEMGPFKHEPELDDLAVRMFRRFSRFEYALKASGKLVTPDGDAKPNWDGFAREIHQAIEERRRDHAPLDESIRYLMSQPPKKQVARDSRLDFEDTPATSKCDTEKLLVYVRRVRNNLFHGGKFSETWPDRIGDTRLMRASLVVLEGCLEVSDLVRTAYEK